MLNSMATLYLDIQPSMLRWAMDRAGKSIEDLSQSQRDRVAAWLKKERKPTYRQLQVFSKAVHVPFGYLFLQKPPEEQAPQIPDFRTKGSAQRRVFSLELVETLAAARARQEWYRQYLVEQDAPLLSFVSSASLSDRPEKVAERMRELFRFTKSDRTALENSSRDDYRNAVIDRFEQAGILISIEGYVGSNTRRLLDEEEFRGFVLCDALAPLIFVNGRDWPAAQLFTLAHECAHLFLGQDALTDAGPFHSLDGGAHADVEIWCNRVAAEFLVPLQELPDSFHLDNIKEELSLLRRRFKVSSLVVLQRLYDKGVLNRSQLDEQYAAQIAQYRAWAAESSGGGSTHATRLRKVGRRFAKAVLQAAGGEGLTYTEAFQLLGVKNTKGLDELRKRLPDS